MGTWWQIGMAGRKNKGAHTGHVAVGAYRQSAAAALRSVRRRLVVVGRKKAGGTQMCVDGARQDRDEDLLESPRSC